MPIGYAPAWSPSGDRIAFVTKSNLWVANADGTHRGELVPDADEPAWSPNGRRLAFTRKGRVYTVRLDGLDTASLRIRLLWRAGYPTVRVLRKCPATATC